MNCILEKLKDYLKPCYFIAVIICLGTYVSLYLIEFRLYGGVFETIFSDLIFYPLFSLVSTIHDKKYERKTSKTMKTNSKAGGVIYIVVLVAIFACLIYSTHKIVADSNERLKNLQTVSVELSLIIIFVLAKWRHIDTDSRFSAFTVIIIYSNILIFTLAFLLIARPHM